MKAYNPKAAYPLPTAEVTIGPSLVQNNDNRHGEDNADRQCEQDQVEEINIAIAAREVAEFQEHWTYRRDLGGTMTVPLQERDALDPTHEAGNPVLSTLMIAQHEWKKVLDGTKGQEARRPMLPITEAINNTYWGDECSVKDGNTFRLYVQNVNGLPLDRRGGQFDTLSQVHKEVQADVFLGQEHNLDSTQYQVKSILHSTCQQHWERYKLNIATTPISFTSMYKPGGTFMVTTGNATGRITAQAQDKWGRWVSQTFQGVQGRAITIVSAYQVVTDVARGGSNTTATQQYSLLVHERDSVKAPRSAFRRDLKAFLQMCKNRGDELILVGDFNEALGDDADSMLSVLQDLNLIEMMGARHSYALPATYSRGRKCLDYGFATENVCTALIACGYESFGCRFPSDHRAHFYDFDIRKLFGTMIQPLSKFEPRLLYSTNAKQVTSYLRRMHSIIQSCNAYARGDSLENQGNRHAFAERLDSDILQASLASERSIPKFHTPEWSKALVTARSKASLFQKMLSCLRHNKPFPQHLLDQFQKLCSECEVPHNKAACQYHFQEARQQVSEIVKDSFSQRDTEFRTKIAALESSGSPKDRSHANVLRQMIHAERKRQMFRKLKAMRNPEGYTSGITRIEVPVHENQDPKSCTEWKTIDIPSEVLLHLQHRNRRHFGQADGTPFTVPPLSEDLGFCADTPEAQALLEGTYDYDQIHDPIVRLFLKHMTQIESLGEQLSRVTITEEEMKGKLRVWRESTSTSPSGQHLGHFKALVARHEYSEVTNDDDPNDVSKRDELDLIQTKLLRLRLQIVNYSMRTGYSYKRWQTIANTHILKEPGNVKVHRTRVIHIYEADYNLALGVKWRQAMHLANDAQVLNDGHYGSRPRRQAQDPVLLEELQLDLSRVSRKTLVVTNYDATSCYDRIIPSVAMLASRKFGVPKSVTLANAHTLEHAQYRIRTDLGLATTGYSHSAETPIYGTGQGSANGPMLWLFIDSVLYDCYEAKAHPAVYCTPDKKNRFELGMAGFVDDSNGQTNQFERDEIAKTWRLVLQYAQENAQHWSDLLHASGGALELSKCSFHLLRWSFSISGAPVLTVPDDIPDLVARDPQTAHEHRLPMLSPFTAHKTLGHYKEPSGSQVEQGKQLQTLCADQVSFLWKSPLTRLEAWYFYKACFIPCVSYPLANSHFSIASLQKIQRTAMSIIVAKCGYNRHMKREVLFGPTCLGGAAFVELYDQQGIGQVTSFLRHWRTGSKIGKLLRCLLAWTNYSVGISVSVLEDVTTPLPHLEAKWIGSLREYLRHTRAWIDVDDAGIAPIERENDDHIMDIILQSQQFTPAQIRTLNYCRVYLGALTLSDLTTTGGLYFDNAKLKGHVSRLSSRNRWLNIYQDRPAEAQWILWRRANKLWSSPKGRLNQPLGRWLRTNDERRMEFPAYIHRNVLAIRVHEEFQIYNTDVAGRQIGPQLKPNLRYEDLHPDANPVEAYEAPDGQWTARKATETITPAGATAYDSLDGYFQQLQPWEADLLQHVKLVVDPRYVCFDLQHYFYAGSDGSVKHETNGSFGWIISNTEGERVVSAMGPARCAHMDSYRAECTGMLSLLRFLIRIAIYANMDECWRGLVGTDSQSMLDRLYVKGTSSSTKQLATLDVLDAEWDLLIEIQEALRELPGVDLIYVKGHQDARTRYDRLPLMAQLNVDADRLASTYHQLHGACRPFVLKALSTGAFLQTDDGTVTSNISSELRTRSTKPGLEAYIRSKNNWEYGTFEQVNWSTHGKAVKAYRHRRVHLTKYLHDALPTFHRANLLDGGTRKCAACGSCDETTDHILRCTAHSREEWRTSWWSTVESFHDTHATHPLLRYVFKEAVTQWFQVEAPDVVSPILFPQEVRTLIQTQNAIGWRQIFRGRFSKEWQRLQNLYYMQHKNKSAFKRTGVLWQKQFITTIWELWFQLWNLRNGEVHGTTVETRAQAQRFEVARQLTEIYNSRGFMEPTVEALLETNQETHAQKPVHVTKNWLAMAGPVIRTSVRRIRKASVRGVRSMRSYFPRTGDG